MKKPVGTCKICSNTVYQRHRLGKVPQYCSSDCRKKGQRRYINEWRRKNRTHDTRWRPNIPKKKCEYCSKPFSPLNKEQKYCSLKCAKIVSGMASRKPLPKCEFCGELCKRLASRFCSQKCSQQWYRGENVYNYLGPEGPWRSTMGFYTSTFWYEQCSKVRRRDKVCQRCGKTPKENGKALDVHHVIPRRISQDDSTSNLTALCRSCHPIVEAEARELYG